MSRQPVLALKDAQGGVRMPDEQLARDRQPHDPAADHDDVAGCWRDGHWPMLCRH